jgi:hypothetical protein
MTRERWRPASKLEYRNAAFRRQNAILPDYCRLMAAFRGTVQITPCRFLPGIFSFTSRVFRVSSVTVLPRRFSNRKSAIVNRKF